MKKLFILTMILAVFTLIACGEDDITGGSTTVPNDLRLIGRWEGFMNMGAGDNYVEFICTSNTYEFHYHIPESYYTNTELSVGSKGTYIALDGAFTAFETHGYNYLEKNWTNNISISNNSYTISGMGIGALLTIINNNTTNFYTNTASITAFADFAGTWYYSNWEPSVNETNIYITIRHINTDGLYNRKTYHYCPKEM
ncbi:MAG: hypothetical protein KAS64_03355, partial [Spirochaetes bacterium]|nr:hypothetical protein [Spirochaetota bacterium]